MKENLRDELAAYAHNAWSGWMRYLFSKCDAPAVGLDNDGDRVIDAELVKRWTRQMNTPYDELPEEEKQSDLKEAEEMLKIFAKHFNAARLFSSED